MKKNIIFIFILSIMIRFIGLEKFSPPPNRDELALGYNAYSLLQTGKDEHGVAWPLSFQSIGDYKMPGYVYLTLLPVKLFGLNIFAIRFWSAFSGSLAILLIYLFCQEVSCFINDKKIKTYLPIISAFLLAINPWHIHYSRIAFEANVNLTLFLAAITFFFKAQKRPQFYIHSAVLFTAMQFMYSSTFIFLPLFLFALLPIVKFNKLGKKQALKFILISLFIFLIGSILALYSVSQVSIAKKSITVFSDPTLLDNFNKIRSHWNNKNILIAKLFYNKYFYLLRIIFTNYIKSYLPGFILFNKVNHPWHFIPKQGFFYIIDYILIIVGIIYSSQIKNKRIFIVIILWLIFSPVASAITIDAPHATRSLYLIPVSIILISTAWIKLLNYSGNKYIFYVIYCLLFTYAGYQYLFNFPRQYAKTLFSDIKPVFAYLENIESNQGIYFSNLSDSIYLYYLFYNQINPNLVQETALWTEPDTANLIHIKKINNYNFLDSTNEVESGYIVSQITNQQDIISNPLFEVRDNLGQTKWQIIKH